jgi:hypothetical protein
MKIIGLTRIRNEQNIIKDTLDHWGKICTGGIYVYDDASTDFTVKIVGVHPAVKGVIESKMWDPDRERAEYANRQALLTYARRFAGPNDWFVYFDADERLYAPPTLSEVFFQENVKAVACRLYDVYITPLDVQKNYLERDLVGPEFRTIVMFFRNHADLSYNTPDQRIVNLPNDGRGIVIEGLIKHFGKGISVEHWEETCEYYVKHFPKYAAKWAQRRGKAVKHDMKSDFGNTLISFSDVVAGRVEGFSLEKQSYGKN